MSADAVGWVYRHSPYSGVTFAVHQAVADSVNDQFGNEFWLAKPKLAMKARTSVASAKRAMETMVADGYLVLLDESGGREGSKYLFVFHPEAPLVYDARATGSPRTGSSGADRLTGEAQPAHQKQPTGSPESKSRAHKERTQGNPREPNSDPSFDAFWSAYPRNEEKGNARAVWPAACKKADPATIIAAAVRYRADPNREDQFTPYAAKWLKYERWTDAPLPIRRGGRSTPPVTGQTSNTRTFETQEEYDAWKSAQK